MKPITIADLQAVTGLGPKKTRRLVREGTFPGRIEGRDYICTPGEFAKWDAGDWQKKPAVAKKPIDLLHKSERKSA